MEDMKMTGVVKKAVEITSIDYGKFGILYNLSGNGENTGNTNYSSGDGWEDTDTGISLMDTLGSLGYTLGSGTPFLAEEMERHQHTQEAQIPAGEPIVFCLAPAGEGAPEARDVIPVILRPGHVFVIHRGVWHTSSHGLNGPARYYWQALVYVNEPTVWERIGGGGVYVEACEGE